jgi:hypothetical protein
LESHVEIRTLLLIAGGIGLVAYGVLPLLRKMQRKPGESGMR